MLGYVENPEDDKWEKPGIINKKTADAMLAKYRTDADVKRAFAELTAYWEELLSKYHVESSNDKVDRMVNIWNQYQCMVTFNMSRSASYYESGIGRGERAFEIYQKTCPAYVEEISDIHRTEPYVYSQMVAGADAKFHGEAKNSWLTGTAAWTFVNISQYILGLYPTHKGLSIDPCVPKNFGDFTLTRKFREGIYNIKVTNPHHVEKGIKSITVDGKAIDGCVIPYEKGKTEYDVEVVMG